MQLLSRRHKASPPSASSSPATPAGLTPASGVRATGPVCTMSFAMRVGELHPMTNRSAPGAIVPDGAPATVRGVLCDGKVGDAVGEFFSTAASLTDDRSATLPPDQQPDQQPETQLFTMGDGSISGAGVMQSNGTGIFTITGGTGPFDGARGTYRCRRLDPAPDAGWNALFIFAII